MDLEPDISNLMKNLASEQEAAKETVMALRDIIPDMLKVRVSAALDLQTIITQKEQIRQWLMGLDVNTRAIYEIGKARGRLETVIALIIPDKKQG